MPRTARLVRRPDRDSWYVYDAGRHISTGTASRAEAQRFLADYRAARERPAAASVTVDYLLAAYLADRQDRAKPGAERLRWAHKPLSRALGALLPDHITDAACRAYVRQRQGEGVVASTARTELQALRAALRWAADPRRRLIPEAPVIEMPAKPPARDRWLTREEAARLVAACTRRHVRLFVLLALHTAARRGAILALTWDRVDLDNGTIDYRDPTREATRKRRVAVPINSVLAEALREAQARSGIGPVIAFDGAAVASIKHGFHTAAERAGLADVSPHTLRHTAVTWMMQAGVDPWQVAGMAGMTLDMVQAVYGHHHPAHLRSAADALAKIATVTALPNGKTPHVSP